ncbi:MAG: energy transducer TonB [Acidobacteria bacterium]|nr:energy transducer TonB [Acidobacteriota bacterium]MCL5287557.1 energy transducer TonB [Acidobacteriota bacterium]
MPHKLRWFFLAVVTLLAAPVLAQQSELDALAKKVAQRLAAQNKHIVVVGDFTVARVGEHPLGSAIAREFLASLRRVAPDLKFLSPETLAETAKRLGFLPMDLSNPLAVQAIALDAGAEASVIGVITSDGRRTTVGIHITDLQAPGDPFVPRLGSEIGTIQSSLTLTAEWEQLRKLPAPEQENGIYRVRAAGSLKRPECAKCPQPDYTKPATTRGTQGIVSLLVTVTADGDTRDIAVLKHVPDGLTEKAVDAVRRWKFTPVRLPNGSAVPVRVKIDVTFRVEV